MTASPPLDTQYGPPRLPKEVPTINQSGLLRMRVLAPWQYFPREQAYLLALGHDDSLARKRRRGERPVTVAILIEWLRVCARTGLVEIGRQSLQALADLIGCEVSPRPETHQPPIKHVISLSRCAGEALVMFVEALSDGELNEQEEAELEPLLQQIHDSSAEALAAIRESQQAGERPS